MNADPIQAATIANDPSRAVSPSFSFPIGYYEFHPNVSINSQLSRFFGWVGDDSALRDQNATLTHGRSLSARLFACAKRAQNHIQVGNMGLAFRTIIDWMTGLGPIEELTDANSVSASCSRHLPIGSLTDCANTP
jgi:hypothetical protein